MSGTPCISQIKKSLTVLKLQYVNFSLGGRNGHLGGQFEIGLPHLLRAEGHSSGKGTSIPKIIQIRSQCPIVEAASGNVSFNHVFTFRLSSITWTGVLNLHFCIKVLTQIVLSNSSCHFSHFERYAISFRV